MTPFSNPLCLMLVAGLCAVVSAIGGASAEDAGGPSLQAPPVNRAPGEKYAGSTRQFQGIPGLERAPNGRLWATWYGGGKGEGPDNYVMLVTSGDDGKTWSDLKLVIDPPGYVRAYDPCLWVDPTGRLWLFWAQSYDWWDGRGGVWSITAEHPGVAEPKWSAPRRISDGVMMNKPIARANGEWLLPVAFWHIPAAQKALKEPAYAHDLGEKRRSSVVVSRDKGKTWALLGQADVPERSFDEHSVVERKDGSLWMLVRTTYGIGESASTDGGKTWSPGRPSGIPHLNSRFFIRRLRSGKLLLVRHNPPDGGKQRSHLTAYLSEDDGKTWTGGLLLDERTGVSYPDGVEAPDGVIHVIYDYARTGDKLILMAAFTEADVAAAKPVSDKLRLRVTVNQATGRAER